MSVSGFGVTLGSRYIEAQGYVPVLLQNLHSMSCSWTCWPLGGAWFQCRYGGVWWAPVDSCSLESGFLWCSQDLDLSLLPLVFSLILTVSSRLLHLLSKTMGCLFGCLMSSASIQKLFCGIYSAFKCSFNEFVGKKVLSLSYSSAILGPPPLLSFINGMRGFHFQRMCG